MRIVCDTNVLVSGVLFGGNSRLVLALASRGEVEICTSAELLRELAAVLGRPKFHLTPDRVAAILEIFQQTLTLVIPSERVQRVTDDPSDDKVLEAALAAGATCIVSGDSHLLSLEEWRGIPVVSPADFMSRMVPQG
jgi:putative PIN family toxin of toxin-antitoxin system